MQTFIALLRGINVGKAKRVPMAELRALLVDQGYSDVATLLNSGNAVFRSAKGSPSAHAKAISTAILARFNFEVPVIVKSAQELAAIVLENPINADAADHAQLLVAFVQTPDDLHGLHAISSLAAPSDQFVVGQHAAYLHCTKGILASPAAKALLGKVGNATTTRNWATVLKLQTLANASDC
jgi:uncharacterized protein (DUF1697 family)